MSKKEKRELAKEHLEFARSRMKLSKFSVLVGFEVEQLYEGGAVLSMRVEERHRQIHNVVHGGVIAALADTAAAIAAYTVSAEGLELVTIELKINYLLPITDGKVEAEGRVLRAGSNFVVVECDIRNEESELAAKALMTFGVAGRRTLRTRGETAKSAESGRVNTGRKPRTRQGR